ncbi:MAG: DUF4126 domain-containing protein [Vicinamibacterales bacterium]
MALDSFTPEQIAALLIATSFAAGLNTYATGATLGLLERFGAIALPPALEPLASWWVIGACLALFTVEFFADKVPAFDLVWNALHTFVRVPAGALLAWAAATPLSPEQQLMAALAGAGLAFLAHAGKMAARAAVTPSPEPLSNTGLSLAEDAVAIGLTWFATTHPLIAAFIVLVFVVMIVVVIRVAWRALRALFRGARRRLA